MDGISIVFLALSRFIGIYLVLLIIRVLLSWFPNVDWSNPAFSALSQITDPYLNLFRSIIPPLGGIDFSAILAFIVLQFVQSALSNAVVALSSSSYMAYSAF
ncbi:MAG: YggT family protein [Leptolyngbyaceae cyanobacterium MAG.088]|nr:YggT family protein [Leptolyngbyaceae cyanobacterium MAG.088]